jgi:hypothetical protein
MMEQRTSNSMKLFGRNKQQQSETDEIAEAEKLSQQNELGKTTNPQSQENRNQQQEQSEQSKILVLKDLSERAKSYKPRWDKNGVIQFKSEYICILQKKWRSQVEFIVAFEDLTREGYRLMAIDSTGKSSDDIVSSGTESYYYFQKME